MRKLVVPALTALLLFLGIAAQPAFADPGLNNCWGTVVSQRASHYHDVGEHSAAQTEPRLGVGNIPEAFGFPSIGAAAQFLAILDDLVGQDPDHVTRCP